MITRRSVLKSMALMTLPAIRLRPETHDREAMVAAFADHAGYRSHRYDLQKPFLRGDLTYATDGVHMVRACLPGAQEDGETRLPDVEYAWRHWWTPDKWQSFTMPTIGDIRLHVDGIPCPSCGNRRISLGKEYPPYEWMDGDEAHIYDYDIDENNMRDKSCRMCRGKDYQGANVVNMGGVLLAYHRIKPIAGLPDAEWSVSQSIGESYLNPGKPPHGIVFRSRAVEIEGLAMGVAGHNVKDARRKG